MAIRKRISRPDPDIHKRVAPRIVVLQSMNCYVLGPGAQSGSFRANLIDISATGMQIYTPKPMDEHTVIAMEVRSKDGFQSLTFTGTVVWARRNAMKSMGRFAYGVVFNAPSRDLKAFVAENFLEIRDQNTP